MDQIDFIVPDNVPQGCWTPVYVRTSHATLSNFVSMAIDPQGAPCSNSAGSLSSTVVKGGSLGTLALTRMAIHEDIGVNAPIDIQDDFLTLNATKQIGGPFVFAPFLTLPPAGSCTVFQGAGDFFETVNAPQGSTVSKALDGGTQFMVTGPNGPRAVSLIGTGGPIGSFLPLYQLPNTLFLSPGPYTVTGPGGADIGAINASLTMPPAFAWTNRDQTTNVKRSQPLALNWTGGASGQTISILGASSDLPTNSSAAFFCVAPVGATSFTIPAEVLSALPASQSAAQKSKAAIFLIGSSDTPFTASGLQTAFGSAVYVLGKTVSFQ